MLRTVDRATDLAAATRPGASLTPVGSGSYALDGGIRVVVVDRPEQLAPALATLRAAAAAKATSEYVYLCDPPMTKTTTIVAIDLEWRPGFRPGSNNPVALIQLEAHDVCVLVRTCCIGFPAELQRFLSDAGLTFVGLNWAVADERKMLSSFGWTAPQFGAFQDLGQLASGWMGGSRPGLAALAERVLGLVVPKSKTVTLSDWAAPSLGTDQIRYATLDALLVWHIHQRVTA